MRGEIEREITLVIRRVRAYLKNRGS
jgi:hypothetical protein